MSRFLEECLHCFGSKDLYYLLSAAKEMSPALIKKCYYKTSLKYHPDRVDEGEKVNFTRRFQLINKAYSILSDKDKRALYDESGEIDDEEVLDETRDWVDYWRLLFPPITTKDIDEFTSKYKGSDEEKEDLIKIYQQYEGDMDSIMECAITEDETHVKSVLSALIEMERIVAFKAFTNEPKKKTQARKRRREEEANEAAKESASSSAAEAMGGDGGFADLTSMIAKRQASRQQEMGNFFGNLEQKYCNPRKKNSSKNVSSKSSNKSQSGKK